MTDRMSMLQEFLKENPNDAFARYGLALEHINAGNAEAGLSEFKILLENNPDYTAAYQMAGQTLAQVGRREEAVKMLSDGIATARRTGNNHAMSEMEALLQELKQ
jgi:predicted Zn-dependent protease